MWLAAVIICAKSKHRLLANNVIVVLSCSVSCWGSPAVSGCAQPSALTLGAGRLILFLPFGAGLTPLFAGSFILNVHQNILCGSCHKDRFEGRREKEMV